MRQIMPSRTLLSLAILLAVPALGRGQEVEERRREAVGVERVRDRHVARAEPARPAAVGEKDDAARLRRHAEVPDQAERRHGDPGSGGRRRIGVPAQRLLGEHRAPGVGQRRRVGAERNRAILAHPMRQRVRHRIQARRQRRAGDAMALQHHADSQRLRQHVAAPHAGHPGRFRQRAFLVGQRQQPGGVTVLAINLDTSTARLDVAAPADLYTLTAAELQDRTVLLNGQPLALTADDRLPAMEPARHRGDAVDLPPHSINFVALPEAGNPACR